MSWWRTADKTSIDTITIVWTQDGQPVCKKAEKCWYANGGDFTGVGANFAHLQFIVTTATYVITSSIHCHHCHLRHHVFSSSHLQFIVTTATSIITSSVHCHHCHLCHHVFNSSSPLPPTSSCLQFIVTTATSIITSSVRRHHCHLRGQLSHPSLRGQ